MNETMVRHRLSRNVPVNHEVAAAITRMDGGPKITRVWAGLDSCVTMVVESDRERLVTEACKLADRMLSAQLSLADALYRREWGEDHCPLSSVCCQVPAPVD